MFLQIAFPEPAPESCQFGLGDRSVVAERDFPVVRLLDDVEDRSKWTVADADYPKSDSKEGEVVVGMLVEPSDGGPMRVLEIPGDPDYGFGLNCLPST